MTTPKNLTVANNDLWILLLSCIRYSVGCRTYMTSLAPELVQKYSEALTDAQIAQMAEEIKEVIRLWGTDLDDDCDIQNWRDFDAWCSAEFARRKGNKLTLAQARALAKVSRSKIETKLRTEVDRDAKIEAPWESEDTNG
jgi:hypothetical protein